MGLPLRELGPEAKTVHQQIFTALKAIKAEVFWTKPDFADLGRDTLGENFHEIPPNITHLESQIKTLKNNDVILLESKLSADIINLLS